MEITSVENWINAPYTPITHMRNQLAKLLELGCLPSDDANLRLKKKVLLLTSLVIIPFSLLWGIIYILLERPLFAVIPIIYPIILAIILIYYFKTKSIATLEAYQLFMILVIPFLQMWLLGGFHAGSMIMLWAIITPISALIFLEKRAAKLWFLAYMMLIIISALIDDYLQAKVNPLPQVTIIVFYVMNLCCVSGIFYLLVSYSIYEEKRAIKALTEKGQLLEIRTGELNTINRRLNEENAVRKQAQVDLEMEKKRAEAATRSKSEFLANMSHEVRTPMNGVIATLELLQVTTQLDEKQKRLVEMSRNSAKYLLVIINDILDYSKIDAGQLNLENTPFDLRDVVSDTFEIMNQLATTKNIELKYFIQDDLPSQVSGDPVRLRQVLVNLISNAIKFTHQGEVSVNVTLVEKGDEHLSLRFDIKDSGIGVSAEKQAGLFDAFSQEDTTTTRKYGGTGLGLSISKQLTKLMGGKIGVDSVKGQGSTFWFTVQFEKVVE